MEHLPKIGDIVTVTTKYRSNYIDREWDINTYENVPVVAHNYPTKFSIQVDIHYPGFIFRVADINLSYVESLIIVKSKHPDWKPGKPIDLPEEHFKEVVHVTGSTGNKYTVLLDNKIAYSCTCPGFYYRKKCRHLREAELQNDAPKTVSKKRKKHA